MFFGCFQRVSIEILPFFFAGALEGIPDGVERSSEGDTGEDGGGPGERGGSPEGDTSEKRLDPDNGGEGDSAGGAEVSIGEGFEGGEMSIGPTSVLFRKE